MSLRPLSFCPPEWKRAVHGCPIRLSPKAKDLPFEALQSMLERFSKCDWGNVKAESARNNNRAVREKPTKKGSLPPGWQAPSPMIFAKYPSGERGNPLLFIYRQGTALHIIFDDELKTDLE